MPFGPRSALVACVDGAIRRVNAPVTVSGEPAGFVLRPDAPSGERFSLEVTTEALGARVVLSAEPLSVAYTHSLAELYAEGDRADLASRIEEIGATVEGLALGSTRVDVSASLAPSADAELSDLARLEELLVLLLGVALSPYERAGLPHHFLPATRRSMISVASEQKRHTYDAAGQLESTNEHRQTENALIDRLLASGLSPFNGPLAIQFDVGWVDGDGRHWVCEVKSTVERPQEQFRLGLGQVAEYRHRLRREHGHCWHAVLVLTRRSHSPWNADIAASIGVALVDGPPFDPPVDPLSWGQHE